MIFLSALRICRAIIEGLSSQLESNPRRVGKILVSAHVANCIAYDISMPATHYMGIPVQIIENTPVEWWAMELEPV